MKSPVTIPPETAEKPKNRSKLLIMRGMPFSWSVVYRRGTRVSTGNSEEPVCFRKWPQLKHFGPGDCYFITFFVGMDRTFLADGILPSGQHGRLA
jgi:hypothetical protein